MREIIILFCLFFSLNAFAQNNYEEIFYSKGLFKRHVVSAKCHEVNSNPTYCHTTLKYEVFRGDKLLETKIMTGDRASIHQYLRFMTRKSLLEFGRETFPLIHWSTDWRWFGTFLTYPVTVPLDILKLPFAAPIAAIKIKYRKRMVLKLRDNFEDYFKRRRVESIRIRRAYFKDLVDGFIKGYPNS